MRTANVRSDVGKKLTYEQKQTTTPVEYIDKLKEKIWRRSHSQRSVNTFNDAIKSFEKFLAEKNMQYEEGMKNPIEVLDIFASWLDVKHSGRHNKNLCPLCKKDAKVHGCKN